MVAQGDVGRADADFRMGVLAQLTGELGQLTEERLDVCEELFSPALVRRNGLRSNNFAPTILLELSHLPADRRLLDAVGDLPHGRADPAGFRHVVEKLEVMNVHGCLGKIPPPRRSNAIPPPSSSPCHPMGDSSEKRPAEGVT